MKRILGFLRRHGPVIELILVVLLILVVVYKSPQNTDQNLSTKYSLLSSRIFVDSPNNILINFVPLRDKLTQYINSQNNLGVYFEYLPSGNSIGINDKKQYRISSLVKVPNAMVIYKKISLGKLSLDQKITIKKEFLDDKFGNVWKLGEGAQISVRDALKYSLEESDNTANNALLSLVSDEELIDVFQDLDVPVEGDNEVFLISPKNYSSIFRSLYLSSYLDYEYSNQILDLLTHSVFNNQLPSGLDSSVTIAHKIGVFQTPQEGDVFSDCGIIYLPKRPYMLCVMVNDNQENANKVISDISKMVYQYLKNY